MKVGHLSDEAVVNIYIYIYLYIYGPYHKKAMFCVNFSPIRTYHMTTWRGSHLSVPVTTHQVYPVKPTDGDHMNLGISKNRGTPKSSILIGFSTIFTIHFQVPLFLEGHPYIIQNFRYLNPHNLPGWTHPWRPHESLFGMPRFFGGRP